MSRLQPIGTRRPIGAFAALEPLPHELSGSVHRDLLDAMTGDPGLRLASGTGRRRFHGGLIEVQRFVRGQGEINSPEALEVAPVHRNRRRSAISRGTPDA